MCVGACVCVSISLNVSSVRFYWIRMFMCACCEVLFLLSFWESNCYGFSLSFALVHSIVSTAAVFFFFFILSLAIVVIHPTLRPVFCLGCRQCVSITHSMHGCVRWRIVRISWRDDGWAISVRILCVYDKYAYVSTTQCERDSFVRVPHSFTHTHKHHTHITRTHICISEWFLHRPNNDNTLYGIQYTHQHVWAF